MINISNFGVEHACSTPSFYVETLPEDGFNTQYQSIL
ncbi:MAG: hypothetical protein KatS3mg034_1800 [Vicingaceae bacterium]|nr:MAG: hypothetical protein KatS3mg034_1800 [Vicingaceae bacterium]